MNDAARPSLEARMERAVEAMERDFATVRTGRAATSLVERIQVEYYGTMTPLNQLASISIPEPHQVVIQPWDRGVLGAIDKAIQLKSDYPEALTYKGLLLRVQANLEKNPTRQQELVKEAATYSEKAAAVQAKQRAASGGRSGE